MRTFLQHPSGTWRGECEGRVGRFKFINVVEVEGLVGEDGKVEEDKVDGELDVSSVPELLASLGLHQLSRFESHFQFCLKTNFPCQCA